MLYGKIWYTYNYVGKKTIEFKINKGIKCIIKDNKKRVIPSSTHIISLIIGNK